MTKRTNSWHQTSGKWARSLGERGMRVRLFQNRKGGMFYRAVWVRGRKHTKAIGTRDRDEAERRGRALLAQLILGQQVSDSSKITLGELWQRYSTEAPDFLDNKQRTRRDAQARADVLLSWFGRDTIVESITADDQRRYERARLQGGIKLGAGRATGCTRARSADADVALLHAIMRWATTVRRPDGGYLLDRNPLQHVRRVREKNRKQPVATQERFEATRAAMRTLGDAASGSARLRWRRLEFALVLVEATGRRLGAVRALRWDDFSFDTQTVHWAAQSDKKGYQWRVRMPPEFFDIVRRFQRELAAVGGHVFAAPDAADGTMDRHLFDKWLAYAEREAGLEKLDGGLWHAYRRKWAIERKHLPIRDVAAAGGWKDTTTLLDVYQQPDAGSMLLVMSERRKLSERGLIVPTASGTETQTDTISNNAKASPA